MSDVAVTRSGPQGMIILRGNLSDTALQAVCTALTGADMPAQGKITMNGDKAIGWMSPDELLLFVPYDDADNAVTTLAKTLQGQHHLAVNVSDARAMVTVAGAGTRDMIAKLTPVDLHPDSLPVGTLRRTHLGQVAAAFWLTDATSAQVICFRSVADYMFDLLTTSAAAGPVHHLRDA